MDVKRGIDAAVENVKENLISSAKRYSQDLIIPRHNIPWS